MSRPVHFDRVPSPRRQALYRLLAAAALAALGLQLAWQLWPREPQARVRLAWRAAPDAAAPGGRRPGLATAALAPARTQGAGVPQAHQQVNQQAQPQRQQLDPTEPAARNAGIDLQALTTSRPMAAQAFLREVWIAPDPRGGFVVRQVLADGVYDRMGLRTGDRVYTLDTPAMAGVDEGSMVAVMQQAEIELDVWRGGMPTRLHVALNDDGHAGSHGAGPQD